MIIIYSLIFLIGFSAGALVQKFCARRRRKKEVELERSDEIECAECDMEYLKEEWKTTIETQMHFNDLIIKFRSVVLSVFITGLGVVYGFSEKLRLNDDLFFVLILAFVFWICCFLLDYFYYHKLLLGAVKHAKKFDENQFFRDKGLFGLTKRISFEVSELNSEILIGIFYLLPLILGLAIYFKLV